LKRRKSGLVFGNHIFFGGVSFFGKKREGVCVVSPHRGDNP
jgi:hypothetical protein